MSTHTQNLRHLQTLLMSFHPVIVIESVEEERIQSLLEKATADLQLMAFDWSISQGMGRLQGAQNHWNNEYAPPGSNRQTLEKTEDPLDVLRHILSMSTRGLYWLKDFAPHLEEAAIARQFREVAHLFSYNQSAFILTGEQVSLPREVAHEAVYFDLPLPSPVELKQAIDSAIRSCRGRVQVNLSSQDEQQLIKAVQGMTLKQTKKVIAYAAIADGQLNTEDIGHVLERKTQVIRETGLLDYIAPEKNTAQLGGFENMRQWLSRARTGYSNRAKAFGLTPPKGILIVGIQGCGKSLAAKTIARQWQMPLLKLDTSQIYDKYIGASEKNLRQALSLAEKMAPAVLWIDEIEKSMGQSDSDTDGGLSRRLFGSFLTWLQEKSEEVFVVATANDLSRLPPELLRKGRFDEIFFVDLPDAKERDTIFQIQMTRHQQNPNRFDLNRLVIASDGFSGAEIEQVVVSALYHALYEKCPVDTALIEHTIKSTVPLSVSRREDLERLRAIAQSRFVSVK
ncbi:AAA family ATPase [cf. Phormidesmis sp. LEGE 11477]|uniref:AAA family ATPase n=1 Tax=cf. Phormidesmis sp. LEGE 11477 TaxID=1828680 RepID=UPI00187E5705|nr:AAA family ATPase [cf. Phormidesmis sp. LEGE 11477]MBE9062362.1 AAA family ATPase [cf. Phormidesmis sp. LEGE 11477]